MSIARCERRYCGSELIERHDRALGRVALVCLPCERNAKGICRDCPAPLARRRKDAMRCVVCSKARTHGRTLAAHRRDRRIPTRRERMNARQRAYNARSYVREQRLVYNRRYRAAQKAKGKRPRTALDRLYINEWQKSRYRNDPVYREKVKRKASARRARRRARILAEKLASGQFRAIPIRKRNRRSRGERFVRLLPIAAEARRAS